MNDRNTDLSPEAVDLDTVGVSTARTQKRTAFIAGLAALAVAATAIGITATSGPGGPDPIPLSLQSPGSPEAAGADNADRMMMPINEFRYVLGGALPDLGASAKVYRLVGQSVTPDDVARMAEALGIDSEVVDLDGYGWEVSNDSRTLSVSGDGASWYVSMWNGPSGRSSDGSRGSDGVSTGNGIDPERPVDEPVVIDDPDVIDDQKPIDQPTPEPMPEPIGEQIDGDCEVTEPAPGSPDTPVSSDDKPSDEVAEGDGVAQPLPDGECVLIDPMPLPEPEPVPAPENLPDANEAERIARYTLNALGVLASGDWQFEQFDGAVQVASCAADAGCDEPSEPILYSRTVIAHRVIDGRVVMGLDWYVDIGDQGVVQSLSGMLADVEVLADYPLRSTSDVFADLQSGKSWYGGGVVALADDTPAGAPDIAIAPDCIDETCELPEPEIIDVTVTDVSLGLQLWYGVDADGNSVQYVVPSYHFTGSFADGTDWVVDLIAVSDEYINPAPADDGAAPPPDAIEPAIVEEVDAAAR